MQVSRIARALCLGAILCAGAGVPAARAEVRLPRVFGSHMVLQRDKPLMIWGWAQPNETVTVTIASASVEAKANDRGEWKATLPAMPAGGPFTLTVKGSSTVTFDDVMIGEVWLCSGQSNMELGVGMARDGRKEIEEATDPGIRLLLVAHKWSPLPQNDIDGLWEVCSPQAIARGGWNGFSAAAYFFGRDLHKKLGVSVGLIDSCWGGTRIESWTPPEGFAATPALRDISESVQMGDPASAPHHRRLEQTLEATEQWLKDARQALEKNTVPPPMPVYPQELLPPHDLQNPTALYNGMIHPLFPFSLRGAIWYQGEANMGDGMRYTEKMKALVGGWRQLWQEGDFPFYFVQIAPYNYGGKPETEAELWEAQAAAAHVIPNSGMAVVNDIGNLRDIHPKDKQDVGHRLALLALNGTYGESNLECSGPTFHTIKAEDGKLRVTFNHADGGLSTRDGKPPDWFEIVDSEEGGYVKANAEIDGSSVLLSAPGVQHPAAVHFAWSMLAEPNLMNSAGLPTGAFRAGTIPKRDYLPLKIPEAGEYQLVYDLDLNKLAHDIHYDVDNHKKIQRPFDRVAYFIELQSADGRMDYLYVSMDAFTKDLEKIGVPTLQSGEHFQENVRNMDVISNVKGIVTGTGLAGGNIEFWPDNYAAANSANVPNASGDAYDFGDQPVDPADGYGSMQVHNHDARQTLFAVNHWTDGGGADLGIGNQPTANPDWTFAGNASKYPIKRLRVLVRCK